MRRLLALAERKSGWVFVEYWGKPKPRYFYKIAASYCVFRVGKKLNLQQNVSDKGSRGALACFPA